MIVVAHAGVGLLQFQQFLPLSVIWRGSFRGGELHPA